MFSPLVKNTSPFGEKNVLIMVKKSLVYKESPWVRTMRIQTWFRAVEQKSGGLGTHDLERQFSGKKIAHGKRSCIWNKYRAGTVAPRGGCGNSTGGVNLVKRVETVYPGTAKWLSLPLWRLVDPAPMEMAEVRMLFEGLSPGLRPMFIASKKEASGLFWRRPVDIKQVGDILCAKRDLDALVAALILVKEAEVTQNQIQHEAACTITMQLLQIFAHRSGQLEEQGKPCEYPLPFEDLFGYVALAMEDAHYFSVTEDD